MIVRQQQIRPRQTKTDEIMFNVATPPINMIAATNDIIHDVMPYIPGDYQSSVGVIGTSVEMDLMKAKGIPLSRKKKKSKRKSKRKLTNKHNTNSVKKE